ncbi:uncharacterized protein A1O9_07436 [Exophiala aquamarina CBS 119918]|uniref:Uncharacterized protein n=1 Tax=Exophiala aquamarina CBS 119918 TaxID=1182545 RepID=A0A072P7P0_9EURO|nr:uncharacterized protein A1O9_07436 [Exophiala aquamarina CBS 119918]KEF55856.1 hypothetical protein A1O9_07436 [Exophiala aquamarina CBS 119918]
MSFTLKPVSMFMVRGVSDMCSQHNLWISIWHTITNKVFRDLSVGMAREMGDESSTIQLPVFKHGFHQRCGCCAFDADWAFPHPHGL